MRSIGLEVFTVDLKKPADFVGDFLEMPRMRTFDAAWISHVLEHQPNPQTFLRCVRAHIRSGGRIFVTVPPMKDAVVGGHLTLWNAGILLYHLILAGYDCRCARVGTYASAPGYPVYNVSVIARVYSGQPPVLDDLAMDAGDIERIAHLFPVSVRQGFDGRLPDIRW